MFSCVISPRLITTKGCISACTKTDLCFSSSLCLCVQVFTSVIHVITFRIHCLLSTDRPARLVQPLPTLHPDLFRHSYQCSRFGCIIPCIPYYVTFSCPAWRCSGLFTLLMSHIHFTYFSSWYVHTMYIRTHAPYPIHTRLHILVHTVSLSFSHHGFYHKLWSFSQVYHPVAASLFL